MVPGHVTHRLCLHLISQNLGVWPHRTAEEPKKQFKKKKFFTFVSGQPWTEVRNPAFFMKEGRKLIGSQPAVSASLSSNPEWTSNLNEAGRGSFIFCPHHWPDGQFILALWRPAVLPLSLHLLWSPFSSCKMLKLWIKCECSLRILMG